MHHPTDRIGCTTVFIIPVMEHWLEQEIAQWVHHEVTIHFVTKDAVSKGANKNTKIVTLLMLLFKVVNIKYSIPASIDGNKQL